MASEQRPSPRPSEAAREFVFDDEARKRLEQIRKCPDCNGRGGSGIIVGGIKLRVDDRSTPREIPCGTCEGRGWIRMAAWSSEIPDAPGWYWIHSSLSSKPHVGYYSAAWLDFMRRENRDYLKRERFMWIGPLDLPPTPGGDPEET